MTASRSGEGRVLPFRRRQFSARHRRPSLARLLLRGLLGAVALVGPPATAVAWVATSPRFELRHLDLRPSERVEGAWLEAALAECRGRHLLWLSLDEVRARLDGHAWIGRAEIRKELPDRLKVEIVERVPAALLKLADGLFFVDGEGWVIAPFEPPDRAGDLVLVLASEGPDVVAALELVERLEGAAPAWALAISEVEVLGGGDYRLVTGALPFSLLVSSGRLESGVWSLQRWLEPIRARFGTPAEVDVRFSGRIVIQPAEREAVGGRQGAGRVEPS